MKETQGDGTVTVITPKEQVILCKGILRALLCNDPSLYHDVMHGCKSLYERRQRWLSICYYVFRIVCSWGIREGDTG